jgi:hypothetical protein
MRLVKLLLIFGVFMGLSNLNAQTVDHKQVNPRLKAAAVSLKAKHAEQQKSKTIVNSGVVPGIDTNDDYMGRKDEFLDRLTVNDLPSDFPKYQKNYGIAGYNEVVDNYYRTHGSIVKEWVKQKLNIQ